MNDLTRSRSTVTQHVWRSSAHTPPLGCCHTHLIQGVQVALCLGKGGGSSGGAARGVRGAWADEGSGVQVVHAHGACV